MRISDTTTANGPRLSSVISPSAPLGAVSMAYRFRSCRSNAARTFGSSSTKRIFSLTRYSRRYSPDFVTHSRPRVGRPVPISQDNPYPQGHLHPKPVLFRPRGQPSADRRGLPDRRWARGATPLLPQRGWATPKGPEDTRPPRRGSLQISDFRRSRRSAFRRESNETPSDIAPAAD